MKKSILLVALLATCMCGFAQKVDNFEVGPYEVRYKGAGDYQFRLRKGVDLYQYFNLKKDTLFIVKKDTVKILVSDPVNKNLTIDKAWVIGVEMGRRMWGFGTNEATDIAAFGQYKMAIGKDFYFNAGLSLAFQYNKTGSPYTQAAIFEAGIPLSIEYAKLRKYSSTGFIAFSLTPLFSTTLSQKASKSQSVGNSSGLRIDPKLEFGAYVPMGECLGRIGLFIRHGIGLSSSDPDNVKQYSKRTARLSVGANLAIVF